jgi:uncharacterized membrane protein
MFYSLIASSPAGEIVLEWIDLASLAIEVLAVAIIVISITFATVRYVYQKFMPLSEGDRYQRYRHSVAGSLLLGLEILVAADVIRTVALEATLQSVAVLGLLVLIRTFLSWSLVVEIEGHWPWKPKPKED